MRHNIHQLLLVMGIANPRTHPSALQMLRNAFFFLSKNSLLTTHRSLLFRNNLRRIDLHHLAQMIAYDEEDEDGGNRYAHEQRNVGLEADVHYVKTLVARGVNHKGAGVFAPDPVGERLVETNEQWCDSGA